MEQRVGSYPFEEQAWPEWPNERVAQLGCIRWEINILVVSQRLEMRCIGPPPLGRVSMAQSQSEDIPADFAHRLRQPLSTLETLAFYLDLNAKPEMSGYTSNCGECMRKSPTPIRS